MKTCPGSNHAFEEDKLMLVVTKGSLIVADPFTLTADLTEPVEDILERVAEKVDVALNGKRTWPLMQSPYPNTQLHPTPDKNADAFVEKVKSCGCGHCNN